MSSKSVRLLLIIVCASYSLAFRASAQAVPLGASAMAISVGGVVEDGHPGPLAGAGVRWLLGSVGELDLAGQVGHTDLPINEELGSLFVFRLGLSSGSSLMGGVNGQRVQLSDNVVTTAAPDLRLDISNSVVDAKVSFGKYHDQNGIVPNSDYRGAEIDEQSTTFMGHGFGSSLVLRAGDVVLPSSVASGTHWLAVIEPGARFNISGWTRSLTGEHDVSFDPSVQALVQRIDLTGAAGVVTSSNRVSVAINLLFSWSTGSRQHGTGK